MSVPALATNITANMAFVTSISIVSLILFIVSISGASDDNDVIQNTRWAHGYYHSTINENIYFGLSGYSVVAEYLGSTTTTYGSYSAEACTFDSCSKCKDAGKTSVSVIAIAIVSTLLTILISAYRIKSNTFFVKFFGIVFANTSFAFSIAAIGAFVNNCYNQLEDDFSTLSFNTSVGVTVTSIGFVLMVIASVLHIFTPINSAALGTSDANRV